jgi:hypothetical protein
MVKEYKPAYYESKIININMIIKLILFNDLLCVIKTINEVIF